MQRAEIFEATDEGWLTAEEAAAYLKVKTRTLRLWGRQGKVRGYVLSGIKRRVWRFRKTDLDAVLFAQAGGVISSQSPSVLVTKGEEQ
jgi:excisionase family DNA binding protein